jgi:hypothetical protein
MHADLRPRDTAIRALPPLHVQNHVTRTAIEMHSSFNGQEVSTESRNVVDSLWTLPPSGKNCAF